MIDEATGNEVCEDDDHDFDGHVECVVCGVDGMHYAYKQGVRLSEAEREIAELKEALRRADLQEAAARMNHDAARKERDEAFKERDEARAKPCRQCALEREEAIRSLAAERAAHASTRARILTCAACEYEYLQTTMGADGCPACALTVAREARNAAIEERDGAIKERDEAAARAKDARILAISELRTLFLLPRDFSPGDLRARWAKAGEDERERLFMRATFDVSALHTALWKAHEEAKEEAARLARERDGAIWERDEQKQNADRLAECNNARVVERDRALADVEVALDKGYHEAIRALYNDLGGRPCGCGALVAAIGLRKTGCTLSNTDGADGGGK